MWKHATVSSVELADGSTSAHRDNIIIEFPRNDIDSRPHACDGGTAAKLCRTCPCSTTIGLSVPVCERVCVCVGYSTGIPKPVDYRSTFTCAELYARGFESLSVWFWFLGDGALACRPLTHM